MKPKPKPKPKIGDWMSPGVGLTDRFVVQTYGCHHPGLEILDNDNDIAACDEGGGTDDVGSVGEAEAD